jgi:hypothetical protein
MSCTLEERMVLIMLELVEDFGGEDKHGTLLSDTASSPRLTNSVGERFAPTRDRAAVSMTI